MSSRKLSVSHRIAAIDAYRGFVMFLMMAEVLHLSNVAANLPDGVAGSIFQFLGYHQTHAEWSGCSLHDLIQPSFSFLVGVALPFSIASRLGRRQSRPMMVLHAAWRALVLVLLGVFLRSVGKKQTYWTFEDTLSQIGLGYVPLFLLGLVTLGPQPVDGGENPAAARNEVSRGGTLIWCWTALAILLAGYWAAFAIYPLPGSDFDYAAVGVPADWSYLYSGFAAHWNKNSNLAWAVDTWFLNLFPREKPFMYNGGGYATLSFIPTLATMVLGLIAGEWLRRSQQAERAAAERDPMEGVFGPLGVPIVRDRVGSGNTSPWITVGQLALAGIGCLIAGYVLDWFGICPSVKRIWTPAWVLFSGGWCFLLLAGFYATLDAVGLSAWAFPLRVIGANSIAAYCIAHLFGGFIVSSLRTNLGPGTFNYWGPTYEPLVMGIAVLLIYWLILLWMYWRRIFLRI